MKSEAFSFENVRLGNLIDIRDGKHDTPKYVESRIPIITSKNLTDSGLCFQDVCFISETDHNQISNRSTVERGDVLYGMIGTIGRPTLVETDKKFSIKNVALFKQSNGKVDNKYLRWLLDSPAINKQIAHASRMHHPPLALQRKFSCCLERVRSIKLAHRDAQVKLDALFASLQHRAFRGEL